jgi:hypothetical protein
VGHLFVTSWNGDHFDDHFPEEMFIWWILLLCCYSWTIIYDYLFINIHNVIFISQVKKLTISVMLSHIC